MKLFNVIYNIINGCLEFYLICFFFKIFMRPKKFKVRNAILFILLLVFITFLCVSKIKQIHLLVLVIIIYLISLLYQANWYIHVFLTTITVSLFSLSEVIVAVLCETILKVDVDILKTGNYVFAGMFISKLIIFAISVIIKFGKHKLPYHKVKGLWLYIIFMLSVSLMIVFVVLDYMYMITDNILKQMVTLISIALLILTNIMLFYIIDKIYDYFNVQQNLILANQLIESQKITYKNLYENQADIRKIRHDMKNVMIGVLHEIENGNISSASDYIRQNLKTVDGEASNFKSGHSVIDTLISAKKDIADSYGIELNVETQLSRPIYIDTIDFSIMFGNALDNAIEATINTKFEKKGINVSVISKNSSLILIFENPVDKQIDVKNLTTTKVDKKQHGFGILQIKNLAERYKGEVFLECSEQKFKTTIIINHNEEGVLING